MQYFGLFLVVCGWALFVQGQLLKPRRVHLGFIPLYAAGVFILTILGFRDGEYAQAALNLIVLFLSVLGFYVLNKPIFTRRR